MSEVQNWLLSAVNNSGAVSPEIRATANNMPVTTPARAALKVIAVITFHFGAPNAYAASRNPAGTNCNMFSVVLMTTGITIKARAITPAQPENDLKRETITA